MGAGSAPAAAPPGRALRMKLIIQIPCYNEEATLPATLRDLPRRIDGIDAIEVLVINDGSKDRTVEVARAHGVAHIVDFSRNQGLAAAFRAGLEAALAHGADIIVNTDADNQYRGDCIERLVRPILANEAEMVIGDRGIWQHQEFGFVKKCLQALGSWVVSRFAGCRVADVTSGFRAYSREAALRINVLSRYTYTHETVIQCGQAGMRIVSVPIEVNPKTRESRLFRSMWAYIRRSATTILRIYTLYRPLRAFFFAGLIPFALAFLIGLRFLIYYLQGQGGGHIQSLILCGVLFNLSFMLFVLGIVADLIGANRKLLEEIIVSMRRDQLRLGTSNPDLAQIQHHSS